MINVIKEKETIGRYKRKRKTTHRLATELAILNMLERDRGSCKFEYFHL